MASNCSSSIRVMLLYKDKREMKRKSRSVKKNEMCICSVCPPFVAITFADYSSLFEYVKKKCFSTLPYSFNLFVFNISIYLDWILICIF